MATKLSTKDFKMPTTKTGDKDKRYKTPQFCKDNGVRDMRTKLTSERKSTIDEKKTSKTKRITTHLVIPSKVDGTVDKRYKTPQFCNSSGKKDKRTTSTRNKSK